MPRDPSTSPASAGSAQDDVSANVVLYVRFRLRQADHLLTVLPLAAFLENLDALETFQDVTLSRDGAGSF